MLPTYTPTGTVATLPPPTLTASATKSVNVGNGWFDAQDTASAPTEIAGCNYPNAWDPVDAAVPPSCGVAAGAVVPTSKTVDPAALTTTDVRTETTATVPAATTAAVPAATTTAVGVVTTTDPAVVTATNVGVVPTTIARRNYKPRRPQ